MDKNSIRYKIRTARKSFDKNKYQLKNEKICKKLEESISGIVRCSKKQKEIIVGLYLPMQGEPDLLPLLENLPCQVCMPVAVGNVMHFVEYNLGDEVESAEGLISLKQPVSDVKLEPDIVVVPGIAFSMQGARVGFGVGHYDIFFAKNRKNASIKKIGICFHENLQEELPQNPHDINMDYIITEQIIIKI